MRTIPVAAKPYSEIVPTLSLAAVFEPYSDWFLTDTYLTSAPNLCDGQPGDGQPVAGYVGITGQTSDWDVCRQLVLSFRVPVILAGGIGPDNAIAGINAVSPAGIDSCTRTNREDEHGRPIRFEKDPDKVKLFVNIAHSIKNQTRITN
jgi:phosphoribosylanthranilate isomerase